MADNERVLLSDLIEDLRQQLQEAQVRGKGQDLVFAIEKAELEAKVAVSRTGKIDGKLQIWVIGAGGGYEQKGETGHTIKLTFTPKSGLTGKQIEVSGETDLKPALD
jgi:hypothetical protein